MWKLSRPSSAFAHHIYMGNSMIDNNNFHFLFNFIIINFFFDNNFLGIEKTMKLLIEFTTYDDDDDDDDGDYYYCYYYYYCLDCVEMLLYSWQANGSRTQSHTHSHIVNTVCVYRRTLARIKTFLSRMFLSLLLSSKNIYIHPSKEYYESRRVKVRKECVCVCARKRERVSRK